MSKINMIINGISVSGNSGDTILKIATDNGIKIPTLCHDESVPGFGACGICVVEPEKGGKLLRACSTLAAEGMSVNTESPRVIQARKIALELIMSDHEGDCLGPCTLNCPAGTDCQGYIKQIALGNYSESVKIMKDKLPLPASIGRVCPHPCETACRRKLVEQPMSIAFLKYFAADRDLNSGNTYRAVPAPATGKRVGIIGGGPAGLSAAYFLGLKGHSVTVYDAMPQMGGMLRYGIPEYRLPKAVLDREIEEIASAGDITFKNNFMIGKDATLSDIRAAHDAVIIAIGAWTGTPVGCPGEDLDGVFSGIDFLREVALGGKPAIGDRVAVMGGGNVAMDACRTAVRLGAKEVYIVYRRTKAEMPADQVEIEESEEEGVIYKLLTNPAEFIGEDGHIKEVKLQIMELGEPDASGRRSPVPVEGKFEYLPVDSAIAAFGQKLNVKGFEELELNRRGNIAADEASFRTNLDGVFAVGDATNKGADIAISAIGEAGKAAAIVDAYLNGVETEYHKPFVSEREVTEADYADKERIARIVMPARPAEERKHDFEAVYLGFSEEAAQAEARRCLECGCHDYKDCSLICHANRYPIDPSRFGGDKHEKFVEQRLVSIERDQGKCILCGLCVRICDTVAKKGILGLVGRGFTTTVKPEFNNPETISVCADCLKCAEACPTGALKILKK